MVWTETIISKERVSERMEDAGDLPLCRFFLPTNCEKSMKHDEILATISPFYHNLWGGLGGSGVAILFLVVAVMGIYWELNRETQDKPSPSDRGRSGHDGVLPQQEGGQALPCHQQCAKSVMHFWTERMTFTRPMVSFKLYLSAMILMELLVLQAPHFVVLSTPEAVDLYGGLYPIKLDYEPEVAKYMLPGLSSATLDSIVARLQLLRTLVLVFWSAFLLTPRLEAVTYCSGAVLFIYLGCVGWDFVKLNAVLPQLWFMVCSIPAVPWMRSNPRVATWLRTTILFAIMMPIYFLAGLSKVRYMGIAHNFSGEWVKKVLKKVVQQKINSFPELTKYATKSKPMLLLLSLGNFIFEIIMPLWLMVTPDFVPLQLAFLATAILFHISIVVIMGANFLQSALLCFYCMDPLSWFRRPKSSEQPPKSWPRPVTGDWLRVGISLAVLCFSLRPALVSDLMHLSGKVDWHKHYDPRFPFSEWKMYAKPLHPSYHESLAIVVLGTLLLLYSITMTGRSSCPMNGMLKCVRLPWKLKRTAFFRLPAIALVLVITILVRQIVVSLSCVQTLPHQGVPQVN